MHQHHTFSHMIYEFFSHLNPVACFVGFTGGCISVLDTMPNVYTSSLVGSGFVSIFLALCTIVGTKIGNWIIKKFEELWEKYKKNRK
jgi:hypothetical protein